MALEKDASRRAVLTCDWLIDKVDVPTLYRPRLPLNNQGSTATDCWEPRRIDLLKSIKETAAEIRESCPSRFAYEIARAHKFGERRIGQLKDQAFTTHNSNEA